MAAVPLGELTWLAIAVIAGGVVSGLLAGLFGIGGGAVIVPVLFEVFRLLGVPDEVRMQLCVGTSLAIIVPTTVRSYWAHRAKGLVVSAVLRSWTLPAVIGVALGSITAAIAPAAVFELAFVVIAAIIATKFLAGREDWVLGRLLPGRIGMAAYGFVVGLASSMMGISGGSLATLVMTLYGVPIHNAVATAAGLGYIVAGLPHQALLPPVSLGFVSVIGVVLIAPIASWIAPFGARLAHRLPKRRLDIWFCLFLIAASLRFVASLVGVCVQMLGKN